MRRLELEATVNTPNVTLDAEKGEIEFIGRCHPEDTVVFFDPILKWIEQNFREKGQKVEVNIKLDYFNTSSSKQILKIFKVLGELKQATGNEISINWYSAEDDEDMIEAGEAYGGISKLPFKLVEI